MTEADIKTIVLQIISKVAPESDLENLDPDLRFRDQFDFDSVDFVSFTEDLQKALEVRIPEMDYPQLATLNGCINYLEKMPEMRG